VIETLPIPEFGIGKNGRDPGIRIPGLQSLVHIDCQ